MRKLRYSKVASNQKKKKKMWEYVNVAQLCGELILQSEFDHVRPSYGVDRA
jgi:hypothetical protein